MNSEPLSLRTILTLFLYCRSTKVRNSCYHIDVSLFSVNRYIQVAWYQSSTIVRKYRHPSKVGTRYRPHTSQWINSKHVLLTDKLRRNVSRVCFALKQESQFIFFNSSTLQMENCLRIFVDGCLNRWCQTSAVTLPWALIAEADIVSRK